MAQNSCGALRKTRPRSPAAPLSVGPAARVPRHVDATMAACAKAQLMTQIQKTACAKSVESFTMVPTSGSGAGERRALASNVRDAGHGCHVKALGGRARALAHSALP
jgi:hypothetical protein